MSRIVRLFVDLTVADEADADALAEAVLWYLGADEVNGLPSAIRSVDAVMVAS